LPPGSPSKENKDPGGRAAGAGIGYLDQPIAGGRSSADRGQRGEAAGLVRKT